MRAAMVVVLLGGVVGCAEEKAGPPPRTEAAEIEAPPADSVSEERRDAIERVFSRKTAELQSCWTDEYEVSHNRKLEGDLTLGFTVAPSGQAEGVKVLQTTIKNQNIEGCVVKAITGWSFPDGKVPVPYTRTVHLGAQF